jgi:spermidine synthase
MLIVLVSICPLCFLLGYLTPSLIDEYAAGHPSLAGRVYAINVFGCILGPLFGSYILLAWMSERSALIVLGLPFFCFYFLGWKSLTTRLRLFSGFGAGVVAVYSLFFSNSFPDMVAGLSSHVEVRRDYAASVISADPGGQKVLLVNGIGMTKLTPITKFMVHLPLAFHQGPPQSALIICFGMGTSYRSALSWNIETTTVELVPAVPKAFGFYHANSALVLNNPGGHIVIDDGRRYLKRTQEKFDVIVVDPPPPPEAAGTSLLCSTEFYDLVRQHLKPHGILQAWFPGGERVTGQGFLRSLDNSFPHLRCFPSIEGWGVHVLASMDPIEKQTPDQMAARMPADAKTDLMEWNISGDLSAYLEPVVSREVPIGALLTADPEVQITDDDPLNEYFLLRQMGVF